MVEAMQEKPPAVTAHRQKPVVIAHKMEHVISESGQVMHWREASAVAFRRRTNAFPKKLQRDYASKKNEVELNPPGDVHLGIYEAYARQSIGLACMFFYGKAWKAKADQVMANIDWEKATKNAEMMIASRGDYIRPNLSKEYLRLVAVLSDALEQLTGVDRNLQLAIMTRETRMDHNYYDPKTGNKGIFQLTVYSPIFTYVTVSKNDTGAYELKNVMELVLPEKQDFKRAQSMMKCLFDAIKVRKGRQGDLAMNMLAGALTYRYKFCKCAGKGEIDYIHEPEKVGYKREAVEAYNGAPGKEDYAKAVEKYYKEYSGFSGRLAMVPRKTAGGSLSYAGR
jgi:hypothetical protein